MEILRRYPIIRTDAVRQCNDDNDNYDNDNYDDDNHDCDNYDDDNNDAPGSNHS